MTNIEKQELMRLCTAGYTFKQIRVEVDCSDSTIRRYMRVFKPKEVSYAQLSTTPQQGDQTQN